MQSRRKLLVKERKPSKCKRNLRRKDKTSEITSLLRSRIRLMYDSTQALRLSTPSGSLVVFSEVPQLRSPRARFPLCVSILHYRLAKVSKIVRSASVGRSNDQIISQKKLSSSLEVTMVTLNGCPSSLNVRPVPIASLRFASWRLKLEWLSATITHRRNVRYWRAVCNEVGGLKIYILLFYTFPNMASRVPLFVPTMLTTSSSATRCPRPTLCGMCFALAPHTSANLNVSLMVL